MRSLPESCRWRKPMVASQAETVPVIIRDYDATMKYLVENSVLILIRWKKQKASNGWWPNASWHRRCREKVGRVPVLLLLSVAVVKFTEKRSENMFHVNIDGQDRQLWYRKAATSCCGHYWKGWVHGQWKKTLSKSWKTKQIQSYRRRRCNCWGKATIKGKAASRRGCFTSDFQNIELLGTKVKVVPKDEKGKIEINIIHEDLDGYMICWTDRRSRH